MTHERKTGKWKSETHDLRDSFLQESSNNKKMLNDDLSDSLLDLERSTWRRRFTAALESQDLSTSLSNDSILNHFQHEAQSSSLDLEITALRSRLNPSNRRNVFSSPSHSIFSCPSSPLSSTYHSPSSPVATLPTTGGTRGSLYSSPDMLFSSTTSGMRRRHTNHSNADMRETISVQSRDTEYETTLATRNASSNQVSSLWNSNEAFERCTGIKKPVYMSRNLLDTNVESDHNALKVPPSFEEFFKCFICFDLLQKPVMCPGCSKLGCEACVKRWVLDEKPQCPHCRAPLSSNQLIQCRFMHDLAKQIQSSVLVEEVNVSQQDMCIRHNTKLHYYCHDCSEGACSDCIVIDSQHKEHRLEHLENVYTQYRKRIEEKSVLLFEKLDSYSDALVLLQEDASSIKSSKQRSLEHLNQMRDEAEQALNSHEKVALSKLSEMENKIMQASDQIQSAIYSLQQKLSTASRIDIIHDACTIMDIIQKDLTRECPLTTLERDFTLPLEHALVPPFETVMCRIEDFRILKRNKSVVYSNPVVLSGVTWRLKVYCGGNDASGGTHLSAFVELMEGIIDPASYQYRIRLINQTKKSFHRPEKYERDSISRFEPGECWGYNRFCSFAKMEEDGFWNQVEDTVLLEYAVRAPTYSQQNQDLRRWAILQDKSHLLRTTQSLSSCVSLMTPLYETKASSRPLSDIEECDMADLAMQERRSNGSNDDMSAVSDRARGIYNFTNKKSEIERSVLTSFDPSSSELVPIAIPNQNEYCTLTESLSDGRLRDSDETFRTSPTWPVSFAQGSSGTLLERVPEIPSSIYSSGEACQQVLSQLKSEMTEFEGFVDAVTKEVSLFERILKKSPRQFSTSHNKDQSPTPGIQDGNTTRNEEEDEMEHEQDDTSSYTGGDDETGHATEEQIVEQVVVGDEALDSSAFVILPGDSQSHSSLESLINNAPSSSSVIWAGRGSVLSDDLNDGTDLVNDSRTVGFPESSQTTLFHGETEAESLQEEIMCQSAFPYEQVTQTETCLDDETINEF